MTGGLKVPGLTCRREFLACALRGACGLTAGAAWSLVSPRAEAAGLVRAKYWQGVGDDVQCLLCPKACKVAQNERGFCGARENRGGTYYTMVHGKVAARRVDPMEKDPLYHFRPGIKTFAIATAGCNMDCKFCQSWQMAQSRPEDVPSIDMTPAQVVDEAIKQGCKAICYTYTEPVNFIEFAIDVAQEARKRKLLNVCHTAGYINLEPLRELCQYMDAFNFDLKGHTDTFYRDVCRATLAPVLRAIKEVKTLGRWLEITTLVIPTLNDTEESIRGIAEWIKKELGPDTPYHLSRFFPQYQLKNLPATPIQKIVDLRKVAYGSGLKYVYVGNIPGHAGESTYCPKCSARVVWRVNYEVREVTLRAGRCPACGATIPGYW